MRRKILLPTAFFSLCTFSFAQVGINTTNPLGTFHVDGAKDNPSSGNPTTLQQTNDFVVTANGSVGIGTTSPDPSAKLDVSTSAKGVLLPRVALAGNTDTSTIPSPANGLLVYNDGTGGLSFKGYVYWDGNEWKAFNTAVSSPSVNSIVCSSASLSPSTYTAGTPYVGTLYVPYTGGNGGLYNGGTVITSTGNTGLTATLQSGNLAFGNGSLIFNVTGTPSASSPATANFSIPSLFGAAGCIASVGQGDKSSISDYAQVSFDATSGNSLTGNGTLQTLYATKNIARIKRLASGVFRADFIVPFADDQYVVAGTLTEAVGSSGDNTMAYLSAANWSYPSNAQGAAIASDSDPGNSYGLEPKTQISVQGYQVWKAKYKTHFYFMEGWGAYPVSGGSLIIVR